MTLFSKKFSKKTWRRLHLIVGWTSVAFACIAFFTMILDRYFHIIFPYYYPAWIAIALAITLMPIGNYLNKKRKEG